jgi:EAL domain-containing protein (putative c-di-GMP-specific phosphodiesterase class I)
MKVASPARISEMNSRAVVSIDLDGFIEIAERTGQIHRLGLFVLERSCRDLLPLTDVKLSVNVSPVQFSDPKFVRQVAHVLEQTGFPAARLPDSNGTNLCEPQLRLAAHQAGG